MDVGTFGKPHFRVDDDVDNVGEDAKHGDRVREDNVSREHYYTHDISTNHRSYSRPNS